MTRQSGFTLIELLLVLGIIGVISAIAIPALLGQRERSRAKVLQQQAITIVGDLTTTLGELSDIPSERKTGLPNTTYPDTPAGNLAKAQDAITVVLAGANFANVRNPYTSGANAYQVAATPAAGTGNLGSIYLDTAFANSGDSPYICVTGIYRDAQGSTAQYQRIVGF